MMTPYKEAAVAVARKNGLQHSIIVLKGKKSHCEAYAATGVWPTDIWGEPKPIKVKSQRVTEQTETDAAPDYTRMDRTELERLALKKAQSEGQPVAESTEKISRWSNRIISEYLEKPPPENNHLVNTPLPVTDIQGKAVNIPLPVTTTTDNRTPVNPSLPQGKAKKTHKGMMPNGRSSKGVPDFKNWFGRVYPSDIAYPAWKYLSKTSTDVANICRAKHDHAAARNQKDVAGVPWFEFSFKEAVSAFKISRPTFDKSIKQLLKIGFIKYMVIDGTPQRGNFVNGRGTPARYQLSHDWKTWSPDGNKGLNHDDAGKLAALSRKQNPSKPVFTSTGKRTFTSEA